MDLQKRSDSLLKARKSLTNKTVTDKLHKDGKFSAYDLMGMIFDDGTFVETNAYVKVEEMRRVVVHGVLHLCGQKDKTPRAEREMHRKEDKYLAFWKR